MKYRVIGIAADGNADIIDETDNYTRAVISAMASTNTHTGVILVDTDTHKIERF